MAVFKIGLFPDLIRREHKKDSGSKIHNKEWIDYPITYPVSAII
jgi:hypothetical protein